jgi:ribonuclease G
MLVYLPQDPHIGISQKIGNEQERKLLRDRVLALRAPDDKGGFIVRTLAEDSTDDELSADIDYLRKRWDLILQRTKSEPAPILLYQELSLAERALRDLSTTNTSAIFIDSIEAFQSLQDFCRTYTLDMLGKLEIVRSARPLFELQGVEEDIQKALSRRVNLKSGGYLIIDQTEALTTIDVNTGGFVSGKNFEETIFKNNLEAAHAIARQLRVRNLGGIIIADFIDMSGEANRQSVLAELRRALSTDRTRTSVSEFSALGLVEMTRKRTRESLAHLKFNVRPVNSIRRNFASLRRRM